MKTRERYIVAGSLLVIALAVSIVAAGVGVHAAGAVNIFENFFGFFGSSTAKLNTSEPAQAALYESKVDYEQAVMDAVSKTVPSVVAITISKNVPIIGECNQSPFMNLSPELQQFFGGDGIQFSVPCDTGKTQKQDVGGGSGFIVSSNGLILTNKHVVSDKQASYTVVTNDGKKYSAKVLANDALQDLAVLKIDATGLTPVTLGNSDTVRLGQTAITIGNALGEFKNTVSVGVISGLARNITAGGAGLAGEEELEGVIQTDAAINPGNSGGPILNLRGEVIGINTAIASGAQSVGFAIPINNAKRDISSVQKTGKITLPYIGIRYIAIDADFAKKEGLKVTSGALVRGSADGPGVIAKSPAAKAGIQAEDIITKVNGVEVSSAQSLGGLIQKYGVGDHVDLTVLRGGKELIVSVTLEERKQ